MSGFWALVGSLMGYRAAEAATRPFVTSTPKPKATTHYEEAARRQEFIALLKNLKPLDAPKYGDTYRRALPKPMPGVVPKGTTPKMAMDDQITGMYSFAAEVNYSGYGFMGYALLAELTQIAEFRKPCEILANEMTREWLTISSTDDEEDKTEVIKAINSELERINAREVFRHAAELNYSFGIGQIFIDIEIGVDRIVELKMPLNKKTMRAKVGKETLKGIRTVEPIWNYPGNYNANDPLAPHFYRPETWYILSQEVHASRLLTFISYPVPDILKPAYMFGGMSLIQQMDPYVKNWIRTRQSVSDITHNFSTSVFGVDMAQIMAPGGAQGLFDRAIMYNMGRDNMGLFIHDKEKETFTNIAAPLGSLDKLQAQAQEQMAGIPGIPLVKLLGITPSGLNVSTDGEIRTFYDGIKASQERIFTPNMRKLLDIIMLSKFGEIDNKIKFQWNPLWSLDEEKQAAVRKTNAEVDQIYVEMGALDPGEEVRPAIAGEKGSRYAAIDVENIPDLKEEEEEGLMPEGQADEAKGPEAANDEDPTSPLAA